MRVTPELVAQDLKRRRNLDFSVDPEIDFWVVLAIFLLSSLSPARVQQVTDSPPRPRLTVSLPEPTTSPKEADLPAVPTPSKPYLNRRQRVDYAEFRTSFIEWLETVGRNPDRQRGLAELTVENYAARVDQFCRWVWERFDGYTTAIRPAHADAYLEALVTDELCKGSGEPYAGSTKRKHKDAVSKLFEWRARKRGGSNWETDVTFDEQRTRHADELTIDERRALREGALEYDSLPAYSDQTPEARNRWNAYIAQKLGKPKAKVGPADWARLASWKVPSLIWTALDAGLRPVEVERSNLAWLRLEKGALFIPKEEAAKNRDHWEVPLRSRTVTALEHWLEQREQYPKYASSDSIWLNQLGNPYTSGPLNNLLGHLLDETGIDQTNRQITWYSLRHSVGTHMAEKGDLDQAKEQLRHKSIESTLQYTHPSLDVRRDTLDEMG